MSGMIAFRNFPYTMYFLKTYQFFLTGPDITFKQSVTIGGDESCFVAVATDLNYVRIYSGMGIARQVFCLDGPVVSMASKGDLLIIAYHAGLGYSETETLGYVLIDVEKRKFLKKDRIPISPVSCIRLLSTEW